MLGVTETPITDTGQSIRIQPAPIVKDTVRFIDRVSYSVYSRTLYVFFYFLLHVCVLFAEAESW